MKKTKPKKFYAGLVQVGGSLQSIHEFQSLKLMNQWIDENCDGNAYRRVKLTKRVLKASLPHHPPVKMELRSVYRNGTMHVWFYNNVPDYYRCYN